MIGWCMKSLEWLALTPNRKKCTVKSWRKKEDLLVSTTSALLAQKDSRVTSIPEGCVYTRLNQRDVFTYLYAPKS